MKTNIFKSSIMALAMVASFSACTQDELGTEATTSEDALNVIAYSNDFVSSDAESRVTNTEYTTSFDEGDAIGIFVVRGGQALVSNMKMTLGNDNSWKDINDNPLYYYKDADYIAYYPYTEGLKATSEEEIIKIFADKIGTSGQTTKAEYEAADLMTAKVDAANVTRGENITFNFAHKMSMIEVKVPVHTYTTSTTYETGSTTFSYKVPVGLKINYGESTLNLYYFGDDTNENKEIYRTIVPSTTETIGIDGSFIDGGAEVYFPKDGSKIDVTLSAGTYKGINVTYDYPNYGNEARNLQPGDYFYADGKIYPGDFANAPAAGCVGIIFSTETSETDKEKDWTHGYVIALENTSGAIGKSYSKWASSADVTLSDNTLVNKGALTNMDGYTTSNTDPISSIDAVVAAKAYSVELPDGTSGWYLPSAAQLAEVLDNLYDLEDWSFSGDFAYNNSSDANKANALKNIQDKFEAVGGHLLDTKSFGTGVQSPGSDRWWSTTEVYNNGTTPSQSWALELKANGQVKMLNRNKNNAEASVRPVFAF